MSAAELGRCEHLQRYPHGRLRCVREAGHDSDPRSLHRVDLGEPPVPHSKPAP